MHYFLSAVFIIMMIASCWDNHSSISRSSHIPTNNNDEWNNAKTEPSIVGYTLIASTIQGSRAILVMANTDSNGIVYTVFEGTGTNSGETLLRELSTIRVSCAEVSSSATSLVAASSAGFAASGNVFTMFHEHRGDTSQATSSILVELDIRQATWHRITSFGSEAHIDSVEGNVMAILIKPGDNEEVETQYISMSTRRKVSRTIYRFTE